MKKKITKELPDIVCVFVELPILEMQSFLAKVTRKSRSSFGFPCLKVNFLLFDVPIILLTLEINDDIIYQ